MTEPVGARSARAGHPPHRRVTEPARRMRAQWLSGSPAATVAEVAAHTVGLQGQDTAAARLAVRARSTGLTAADVRAAGARGDVVRTWLMRGTLHLVAAADVRWLLGLFGARTLAATARRRAQLGLDDDTCRRALAVLPAILTGRPHSRADLVAALNARGVPVDPRGQAPAHLVVYAAATGLLCRGPDLDRDEPGYVLLDEWVPAAPQPADPLAELARRYLAAFGPAGPSDLAAWSGLPLGTARRAVGAADATEPAGTAGAADAAGPAGPAVRLLGAYDTYLLGYADRTAALPDAHATAIRPGGGLVHPAVLVDGVVAGSWRLRRAATGTAAAGTATVEVTPFGPLSAAVRAALDAETVDIGRFLDVDTRLAVG